MARPSWASFHAASRTVTGVCLIGNLSSLQILVATIAFLLPSAEHSSVEADKKVSGASARSSLDFVFFTEWNFFFF